MMCPKTAHRRALYAAIINRNPSRFGRRAVILYAIDPPNTLCMYDWTRVKYMWNVVYTGRRSNRSNNTIIASTYQFNVQRPSTSLPSSPHATIHSSVGAAIRTTRITHHHNMMSPRQIYGWLVGALWVAFANARARAVNVMLVLTRKLMAYCFVLLAHAVWHIWFNGGGEAKEVARGSISIHMKQIARAQHIASRTSTRALLMVRHLGVYI